MQIVGITGTAGSGKGTISQYLVKKYGFKHFSVRDFIVEEIVRRKLEINRDNMIDVGNDLRKKHGAEYIVMELFKKAIMNNTNCVLESIRTVGEVEALKKKENFVLWAVDAPMDTRYRRNVKRKGSTDIISFDKFKEQEIRETTSKLKTKQNINECVKMADIVFKNIGSKKDLEKKIDLEIKSLL